MGIDEIKRWHWIVIGLLVGLGLGYAWSSSEQFTEGRNVDQVTFERDVARKDPKTQKPIITGVVIHPVTVDYAGKKIQPVTFNRTQRGANSGKDYQIASQFFAPVPYKPMTGGNSAADVREYLTELAKKNNAVSYRFGWWTTRQAQLAIFTIGSVVLIGGVWPFVLSALVGAGFAGVREKVKKEDYFDRFSHAPEPEKVKAGALVGDAEMRRLDEMNRVLEQQLASAGMSHTAGAPAHDDAEVAERIRKLEGGPLEKAALLKKPEDDDEVEVKGEFYPVLIHHHKKPEAKDAHHEGNGKAH